MTVFEQLPEFAAGLKPDAPLIGLDLGTKTIGIAASDPACRMAMPVETLKRSKFTADSERLMQIVSERKAGGFVLGLPKNMDGSEGPRAQSARAFARNLVARIGLPVLLWDERLSTVAAERTLLEADTSRARRREVIDKMAAAFILQGALDGLQTLKARGL